MFNILSKNRKFTLRGEIVRWENGIQTIRTESSEREFRFLQCMGFSTIQCAKCTPRHPFAQQSMGWMPKPCEHVKVGSKVVMEHKVRYGSQGEVMQGYWTGRVVE